MASTAPWSTVAGFERGRAGAMVLLVPVATLQDAPRQHVEGARSHRIGADERAADAGHGDVDARGGEARVVGTLRHATGVVVLQHEPLQLRVRQRRVGCTLTVPP